MSFRRSSSASASKDDGGSGSGSGSGSKGGRPLSRWLSKTNSLLEQITNAPGARTGEWEEQEARAEQEAERVRCRKCGVVFADKSTLKQHYVLMPKHNPDWSDAGLAFPSSPPTPTPATPPSFGAKSRSISAPSFDLDRDAHDDGDDDDDDDYGDAAHLQASPSQSNEERSRFASQFSKLHPAFYEREIVVRQHSDHELKAGGLGAKIVIGPGHGMTYNPNARPRQSPQAAAAGSSSHARTTSLSHSAPPRPGPSGPSASSHGRSYSVDTGSSLMGFDDDFMGHQGTVKRTPHLERSATEPAIHFDSIEEHDDEDQADRHHDDEDEDEREFGYDYRSDEDTEDNDDLRARHDRSGSSAPTTPPLDSQRRDSIESDDTFLATPSQHAADSHLHNRDDDEQQHADSSHQLAARRIEALSLGDAAAGSAPSEFDDAFKDAGLDAFPAVPSTASGATTPSAEVAPAALVSTNTSNKLLARPAPAIPSISKSKSALAARPAPPPPPPSTTSSLASRRPPAPPPVGIPAPGKGPPPPSSVSLPAGDAGGAAPLKKKRAAPPPPPPRRTGSAAVSK
ncbi:hypothetical protein OC834_005709 [Tilletia horrida]|nr:hypothetical protein OC834_005709 [Tilletia horrida]KAK0557260.1 hypothetical protein OC844_005625 [Tilletia horrida]